MTDQQHPITPPLELVQQWWATEPYGPYGPDLLILATKAARWGADQQLNADCEYIAGPGKWFANPEHRIAELRAAMRLKPPSLKEQALTQLDSLHADLKAHGFGTNTDIIRRALERLQELEEGSD